MQGFLNLHKPGAITSHDCVAMLRRWLGTRKIGHGGTLDPMATGVLPIAVGRATRLLPYLATDKTYRAVIRFGLTTSTDDLEGEVLTQSSARELHLEHIEALLPEFLGAIAQVPPAFSAVQVQGQRLYALARRGHTVMPPSRTVTLYHLRVEAWQPGDYPELTLLVDCGPGTYIRSLARDLGQRLGTGATLARLQRLRSGGFELAQSLTLEAIQHQVANHKLVLAEPETVLGHLPSLALEPDLARRWQQGQKIAPPQPLPPHQPHRLLAAATGEFLGIGQVERVETGSILKAKVVFQPWIGPP
ncbi:MAG TPA: tRNA pseudouridine(55) synthase TruB [Leptolyngbyaceae cyanobacterium M65_K2018_010]|nr:tRNA pseudouridine(55) synthase TruB [Leptolyngbyaceae cyanobacterium M65_K2018_010]